MADDDDREPDFEEILKGLLGGGELDAEQLAQLGIDPAAMQAAIRQLQGMQNADGGIAWDLTRRQALHIANQSDLGVTASQRTDLDQAFSLATLWLSEATSVSNLGTAPRAITRGEWVEKTLPVWQELAEPVATSIADALTSALSEQTPEDMQGLIAGAGKILRSVGGSMFASQLGQVIG